MFDDEVTFENCARNWILLHDLMNSNCVFCMSALYGDAETMDIILEVAQMHFPGDELYERRNELMMDEQKLSLTKKCWCGMEKKIEEFISTEPTNVTKGAMIHCTSLQTRKYFYENKQFLNFPFYSL